jgi:hypothetical protein
MINHRLNTYLNTDLNHDFLKSIKNLDSNYIIIYRIMRDGEKGIRRCALD